jgi:hypothetical protein
LSYSPLDYYIQTCAVRLYEEFIRRVLNKLWCQLVVSFLCVHSHDDETPWCRSYSMVRVYYYNSYLARPYSCSRYCVLCRSYTFSRLNYTLSLCLLKSGKACTTFQSWQQSSPMNGSSTISSTTDMPHQSNSWPFTPTIGPSHWRQIHRSRVY